MTKENKFCSCGCPQTYPIPHEHDQTEREKAIIKHFLKQQGPTQQEADAAMVEGFEQPTAGEFTRVCKKHLENVAEMPIATRVNIAETSFKKACDRLDTAEAINADLLSALKEIRDLETECCPRCEGNGRLYADGKAHLLSENADTVFCGNCGGSGRILPENAQDIAEAAIAKANLKEKKRGGCWPEG